MILRPSQWRHGFLMSESYFLLLRNVRNKVIQVMIVVICLRGMEYYFSGGGKLMVSDDWGWISQRLVSGLVVVGLFSNDGYL